MTTIIKFCWAFSLLFLLCNAACAQHDKSVLLPESEAKNVTSQCSRASPSDFSKTWKPDDATIKTMESKFSDIKTANGAPIENIERFYFQHIGLIVKDKKIIYINAFADPKPPQNWKTKAVIVCDGGNAYWGASYNVQTGEFFDVAFNGR